MQVREVAYLIHEERVVDDELAASLEQTEQARLAVGTLENVVFLDLNYWQPAALRIERVSCLGGLLFLDKQRIARGEPFISGDDFWKGLLSLSRSRPPRRAWDWGSA